MADGKSPEEVEDTEVEENTEEVEEEKSDSLEDVARQMGWNPDDPKGKSAKDYILEERNISKQLKGTVEHLKSKFDDFAAKETARTQKALETQRKRLEEERDKAVEDADTDKFRKVQSELDSLEEKKDDTDARMEAFQKAEAQWMRENEWVNDPAMNGAAVNIGKEIYQRNPNVDPEDFYAEITERIRKRFPSEFKSETPDVESDKPGNNKGSKWNKLIRRHPEVKDIFQTFVEDEIYKDDKESREKYAEEALKQLES